MIGWRKHGHNEVDEPSFTNPQMYSQVKSLQSMPDALAEKMVQEGMISQDEVENIKSEINNHFESEFQKSKTFTPQLKNTTD